MAEPGAEAVVRGLYQAFAAGDRARAEALLAADFSFTSPYDDAIDREAWFARCWPNHEGVAAFRIERTASDADGVFVTYCLKAKAGNSFRNTEHLCIRDGQVTRADVYFGASWRDGVFQAQTPPAAAPPQA